jgi:hypothetical protein
MSERVQKNGYPIILYFRGEPLNLIERSLRPNLDLKGLHELEIAVRLRWKELSKECKNGNNDQLIKTCQDCLIDIKTLIEKKQMEKQKNPTHINPVESKKDTISQGFKKLRQKALNFIMR